MVPPPSRQDVLQTAVPGALVPTAMAIAVVSTVGSARSDDAKTLRTVAIVGAAGLIAAAGAVCLVARTALQALPVVRSPQVQSSADAQQAAQIVADHVSDEVQKVSEARKEAIRREVVFRLRTINRISQLEARLAEANLAYDSVYAAGPRTAA